jgi:hypothetical protein
MFRMRAAIILLSLAGVPPAALAETRCNVPMALWQPKEALENKLRAEGWNLATIRTDDGCYKVRATGTDGKRLKAKFDPATLERLAPSSSDN